MLLVSSQAHQLEQTQAQWGELTAVLAITEPVAVGDRVAPSTTVLEIPLAMAPPNAVHEIDQHAIARTELHRGEIVLNQRISANGSVNSLVPAGHAAITLTVTAELLLVRTGNLVDIWTIDSANLTSLRVARRVTVLALTDDSITVAVPENDIGDVTAASLRPVTVTLVG